MGNDALLLWLSEEVAFAYWLTILISMVGALQLVALHRADLRWLPRRLAPVVGVCLILGAVVWFYTTHYALIFVPGPAGLELMVLFGTGTMVAIWVTKILRITYCVLRERYSPTDR
jgi:hypothetical protein